MISKIIQKEKERQKEIIEISIPGHHRHLKRMMHKQSLINLKEYMEEELKDVEWLFRFYNPKGSTNRIREKIEELKEDIKELTKMIEAYN